MRETTMTVTYATGCHVHKEFCHVSHVGLYGPPPNGFQWYNGSLIETSQWKPLNPAPVSYTHLTLPTKDCV